MSLPRHPQTLVLVICIISAIACTRRAAPLAIDEPVAVEVHPGGAAELALPSPPVAGTPPAAFGPAPAQALEGRTAPTLPTGCPPFQTGAAPPPTRIRQTPPPLVGAAAAVVIDGGSGAVLWGRDEHVPLPPASTTKIVTALLAVERGNLDERITIAVDDRRFNVGSRMGLDQGDTFTLRDLLYGLMLPSGNDAAIVIAQHLGGSEAAFAEMMNRRMCELGLVNSTFVNASGLGRGETNLASAFDLAAVARYALQIPAFAEIVRARTWTARGSRTITFANLNELVHSYSGADGVKIGWTPGAGHTIVASATRNGHRVIVALLNTPNRSGESAALLNWAFASFAWNDER